MAEDYVVPHSSYVCMYL